MVHDAGVASPPPALLDAIQSLRQDDPGRALSIVETALSEAEDRKPYLAIAGMAALGCGKPDRAEVHLRELVTIFPRDTASKVNLAQALVQMEKFEEAIEALETVNSPSASRTRAFALQELGKLDEASGIYQDILATGPGDPATLNNFGNVLTRLERVDEAVSIFEQAITLEPANVKLYLNLAETLRIADRSGPRLKVMQDAERLAPRDVEVLTELGLAYVHAEKFDLAEDAFRRAIEMCPGFSGAHIEYGLLLEGFNRVDDLKTLVASVDRQSAPPEAAFLFAWQARREGNFEQAAELAAEIPETILPTRRWQLVGGLADRLGQIDTAFSAFERMNAAALSETRPHAGRSYRKEVERDLEAWTDAWAQRFETLSFDDGYFDPIFLVGFPRSGTTLLDTMLMGSTELSVLEERPMIAYLSQKLGDMDIADIDMQKGTEFRRAYFRAADKEGWDPTRRLVDKHPLHMQRIPLLHRLFPNARFILAERHPYDVVLSCFMANFRLNKAMRSFTDLREAALTYDAVWRSWQRGTELFDIAWKPVRYERLVAEPENELRQLIQWLGVAWDPKMLDHRDLARTRGRVKTASYAQIREELYTRASNRWMKYSDHLQTVQPILSVWAARLGYETGLETVEPGMSNHHDLNDTARKGE